MTSLLLFLLTWASAWGGTLSVEVLDVGQGDSILIVSPAGKTVLIDGGTGRRSVPGALERRGITSIDLVIATHAHADHIGGLDEVLEAVPVKAWMDSGVPHTTASYTKVVDLIEDKGVRYKAVRTGQVVRLDDGITLTVLGPEEPLLRGTRSDLNSNSVITRIDHGDVCFYMMGDAELETEHRVLEAGLGPCEVLKVAHHGSAYASSPAFLEAVQPKYAAISVGRKNRYGHPAEPTLKRLEKAGAVVLRTDLMGRVLFESNGKTVKAFVAREPETGLPKGVVRKVPPRAAPPPPTPPGLATAKPEAAPKVAGTMGLERAGQAKAKVAPATPSAGKFDLNAATKDQLMGIPGIGPSRADAILAYRASNGPFADVQSVTAVPGIGPATATKIAQYAEVP